ncbi:MULTISPECIES: DUF2201 family putative metallopeptidase [unclassified Halomonas]|uniref:DUF2201 family putative metallopeptidase n=1 Tax=unclassified Halomonas TaxID=2609666 RepID=UPI0005537818|nr:MULTISPECIES: hypothetical protein [unclassified Halomonas]CEP34096.1 Putative uncharacterized protein [Halomonas sp. R57-5]
MQMCSLIASVTTQQELSKWQADRDAWANTLPIMNFLSQLLTLTPVVAPSFDSASTDGRHLYFSPHYSARLSDESRRFLHAHLIWHCVAGHLTAPLVANHHRWHLACDHEVNALLLELGITLPFDALLFPVCVGRSALEVYRWLEGHPNTSLEKTVDIHPAALWAHIPNAAPEQSTVSLWRHRAHLVSREADALPERVAKFCEAR